MAFTVRRAEGSLQFESLGDIERAYRLGLVAPEDEVLEHGAPEWRRADSIPALRRGAPPRASALTPQLKLSLVLALVLGAAALMCLAKGLWLMALLLALVLSVGLMHFTVKAAAPKRSFVRV